MNILAVDDDNAVRISLNVMFRKWTDIKLELESKLGEGTTFTIIFPTMKK